MKGSKAWALGVALVAMAFSAFGKKAEEKMPDISVGYPVDVTVKRGGEQKIILNAVDDTPKDDTLFEIVPESGPKHGTLSGPRRLSSGSVLYIYRHDGRKSSESDSFRFKFKTSPDKLWGYRDALIAISERMPSLSIAPGSLDFKKVFLGDSRTMNLTLKNSGGGTLRLVPKMAPPWSCPENTRIELGEGESINLPIDFTPVSESESAGSLELYNGSQRVAAVKLTGEGIPRFTIPAEAAFQPVPGAATLSLPVINVSGFDLRIEASAPRPLLPVEAIALPSGSRSQLEIRIPAGKFFDSSVRVTVTDGVSSQEVRITLPPPPPDLAWTSGIQESPISAAAGSRISVYAMLRNEGKNQADISLETSPPDLVLRGPGRISLAPGESARIEAVWALPVAEGSSEGLFLAQSGGVSHRLEWKVKGVIPPEPAQTASAVVTVPEDSTSPVGTNKKNTGAFLRMSPEEVRRLKNNSPQLLPFVVKEGWFTSSVEISWKYQGPQPADFIIERFAADRPAVLENPLEKRLKVPGELPPASPRFNWQAADVAASKKNSDEWSAVITGLPPGMHTFRLVTPILGTRDVEYQEFTVPVPAPSHLGLRLAVGIPFLLLCAGYLLKRRVRFTFRATPDHGMRPFSQTQF